MALSKEVKVGLLALVAGIILYIGFNFLKGVDFFSPTKSYYVVYNNVDGLTPSNPVMLNGMTIGRVNTVELMPQKGNKILVNIEIDEEVLVGDCTIALLSNTDLLGGKSLVLTLGKSTRLLEPGDTIKGFKERAITDMIGEKALPILSNLDSTIVKLNHMFGDELGKSISTTLHNLEVTSYTLRLSMAENRENIRGITTNLNSLTASLKETEKSFKPLMAKFNALADSLNDMELKQTVHNANLALKNLQETTEKINKGEGSLGLLVNDKALYTNLNTSAQDLDKLFIDIKKNPKRYVHFSVFGGNKKANDKKDQQQEAPAK